MKTKKIYSILDIIEIIYLRKFLIVFVTFFIFFILGTFKYFSGDNQTFHGTITVFPSDKTELINEINQYSELINSKKLNILGYKTGIYEKSTVAVRDLQGKTKNSNYISPTRLIWEFADILKKKLLEYDNISQIRVLPQAHKFYENHLELLRFNFKINKNDKNTYNDLSKILTSSVQESKDNLINLSQDVSSKLIELLFEENEIAINKIKDLEKMLILSKNNNSDKNELYDQALSSLTVVNGNNNELNNEFNTLNYCLNKKSSSIINECINLISATVKEDQNKIKDKFTKIKSELESNDYNTVNFLSKDRINISYIESSKFIYLSFLVVSLVLSIIFVIIREMIKDKNSL